MAGHRRKRSNDTELEQTLRRSRPNRRRTSLSIRYAAATSPAARLSAAYDYVRGAAARRHPHPDKATAVIDSAAQALIAAGDELLALQARESLRPHHTSENS